MLLFRKNVQRKYTIAFENPFTCVLPHTHTLPSIIFYYWCLFHLLWHCMHTVFSALGILAKTIGTKEVRKKRRWKNGKGALLHKHTDPQQNKTDLTTFLNFWRLREIVLCTYVLWLLQILFDFLLLRRLRRANGGGRLVVLMRTRWDVSFGQTQVPNTKRYTNQLDGMFANLLFLIINKSIYTHFM